MTAASRIARLTGVVALVVLPAVAARSEVVYRERVETFEIGVRDGTPEDIWTAIRRYGPFIRGKHAVGSAAGRLRWSDLSIARQGRTCRLEAHAVEAEVVLTLPEWWRARGAPDDQVAYWRCIERTVTVHEKRHAEIWRETAEAIDRAFRRFDDWMPCDELRAAIGETGNRLFQQGARRQRVFDEEDRRRRRYEQCGRPTETAARSAHTPTRGARDPSATGSNSDGRRATIGRTANVQAAGPAASSAVIGGHDDERQSEDAAEREPSDAASGLAAAILATLAALAAYFGVMAGVTSRSPSRPNVVD